MILIKINRVAHHIMRDFSSVDTANLGIEPALSISIRGLRDFGRVNISVEGMRQNFQNSFHNQYNGHTYIDPKLISRVEVLKGPSSGRGGATAMAGIANSKLIDFSDILNSEDQKKVGGFVHTQSGITKYANGMKPLTSGLAWKP